jgi:molecular chaperone DnaK
MTQPLSAHRNESEEPEPVSLRFRFDSETVEQFAERYASDVSRGGIFVQSRQPLAVGTRLKLDLQLLNGTSLIVGEGTVHWTREPDPAKPNTVPGMGIRFNKLSGRSQQVIDTVLSQRTGKQRTGLFSSVMPAVSIEESQKILSNSNPKSKLPFNVFPGRTHDPSKPHDDRELLANAGREETTPVVGVTAANLADARPGKDEAASMKTPPPAAPLAEMASGPTSASGSKRQPPALALIRPEGGAPNKEAERSLTESARVRRGSGASKAAPLPAPPITTTQEIAPSGSTPPAPVQGEPALGASQSGVPRPIDAMPSQAAIQSVKPPMRNKLIIGAAALLAVTITVFATSRKGPDAPNSSATVVQATAAATSSAHADEAAPSAAAAPSATGTAPTETAPEANGGPALEPEAPAPATSGSSTGSSKPSHVADRRAPKGKTVVAHREPQPAARASSPAAPVEKAPVAEAPAPRVVEAPAPTPAPPPPAPVAHVEPPPAPKPAPVVAVPAPKPAATIATAPPPVSGMAHKLRMTSIPSEAEVELDGKPIGRTPLFGVEIDVSQSHQLVVKKDGFAPFKQTISRSSEWNVRPSENTATLRISALMKKQ